MLLWGSFLLPPQESWDLILTISLVDSTGCIPSPNFLPSLETGGGPLIGFWAEGQDPAKATGSPLRMRGRAGVPGQWNWGPSGVLSEDKPDPLH